LKWARDMPAFRDWRLSGLEKESPNRVTWINGTLGVGKSIMAAYFIDLLKCQYPNAIVAYFFCRSKEAGVFTARDILRALAYQCMEKVGAAGEALKELKSQGFQISDNLGIGYLFEMLLPSTFNKPIQKEDTEADIDTYVMDTVHSSSTLDMQRCSSVFSRERLRYIPLGCSRPATTGKSEDEIYISKVLGWILRSNG